MYKRQLLKNCDFLNIDSSVVTRLGCGGVFKYDCYKFPTESNSERMLIIGEYLVKLWARVWCLVFFDSQCRTQYIVCGALTHNTDVYWIVECC